MFDFLGATFKGSALSIRAIQYLAALCVLTFEGRRPSDTLLAVQLLKREVTVL
jgi:hypothetical protein